MMPKIYRFGTYRLLPLARELWREDVQVALPSRAFDCLVYLIEHRERAVGRDELISAVWGRTDISDTIVAQTILRIRRTLGDDETVSDWIRTVPRFGYRWAADLREEAQTTIPSPRTDPLAPMRVLPTAVQRRSPSALTEIVIIATGLTVLAALAFLIRSPEFAPLSPQIAASAADAPAPSGWMVLPVANVGRAAPDWIRLGVMDAIAERLRHAGLPVLPSLQTLMLAEEFAPPGQPPDIGNLRTTSDSRSIVVPQSERNGEYWHVTLTVHDPERPPVLYRGSGEDALVAAQMASTALLSAQGLAAAGTETSGPRERLLARAEAAMLSGRLSEAESLFADLPGDLANDPIVVLKLAQIRDRLGRSDETRALVDSVLARADLDSISRSAALIRAGSMHVRAGNGAEAEAAFRAALDILPDDRRAERGEAWNGLGIGLHMQGRIEASEAAFARARALHARTGDQLGYARVLNNQGLVAMYAGRPHEGLERYLEAEPILQRFGGADEQCNLQQSIAWSRLFLGQFHAADKAARRALQLAQRTENPLVKRQASGIALRAAIRLGDLGRAEDLISTIAAMPSNEPHLLNMYRAMLALARENWTEATRLSDVSRDGDDLDLEGHGETARILLEAGSALRDRKTLDRALESFTALTQDDESLRWRHWLALAQARIDAEMGGNDRALERLSELWRDIIPLRVAPLDQIETGLTLANAQLDRGQIGEAQAVADHLTPWLNEDYRIAVLEARLAVAEGDTVRAQTMVAHARQLARERPLPGDLQR
jgi:DNA-binding winged helix-turn-helix (wHTH) protein/tetratricopeptide (TPR) repeat protein